MQNSIKNLQVQVDEFGKLNSTVLELTDSQQKQLLVAKAFSEDESRRREQELNKLILSDTELYQLKQKELR